MTRIGIDPLIGAVVLATVFSLMAAVLIASSVLSAYRRCGCGRPRSTSEAAGDELVDHHRSRR